ncbi:hypothetical protein V8E36_003105 [Tilletia maclaganii]
MSRWRDFVWIGTLVTKITFDRADIPIFDPTRTDAMGICALSRFDGLDGRPLSVIEELSRARLLDLPVFAFALSRRGQTSHHGGWLFLGRHRRDVLFSDLDRDPNYAGLWAVRGSFNEIPSTMVFDTVSKLVVLPVHQARFIFTSLALDVEVHDGVLMAKYVCKHPPAFVIAISSSIIYLSGDNVQLNVERPNVCTLSIVGEEQDYITLGLPFFRSAYVEFDLVGHVGDPRRPGRVGIGLP